MTLRFQAAAGMDWRIVFGKIETGKNGRSYELGLSFDRP
jgi:hypothetical protein